ncbi:LysE family translocator [Acidovorax sp. sif1233]|uniref:LysE family translocator n=1 Tax=Acidovorax sp. sif1233 TaxID=2854792 RepID=UPI001C48C6CF|nr:LysE family translocator [Acidovorax sp. sif1233]MBV7456701.1 LysE family translocator [Acidovorax sp. sif1233]
MDAGFLSPALLVALMAYTVGVASPGPSNLAIMAAAMSHGRRRAMALAAGVVLGSVFWGVAAALGMSALMRSYSWSLLVLKVLGGIYMLWLAWKAAHAAFTPNALHEASDTTGGDHRQAFRRGLAMHMTNPKAVFVWLSIVALGVPAGAGRSHALAVVACCAGIGACIFMGYALAFSTPLARAAYARIHRAFNALLAGVFVYAGIRLLLTRSAVS